MGEDRGCGESWRVWFLPAQFTWLLGEGSDLYACHKREAALARLLFDDGSVSTAADLRDSKRVNPYAGGDYLTKPISTEARRIPRVSHS